MTPHLFYILHSGQMFGTERMALATVLALTPGLRGTLLAPPGPVHAAASSAGIDSRVVHGRAHLAWQLASAMLRHRHAAVVATGVVQSLLALALQRLLGGRGVHLHVVHGGTDERRSYGRKRWLAGRVLGRVMGGRTAGQPGGQAAGQTVERTGGRVRFVAVSAFVRERLATHGVPHGQIEVIGNFLPTAAPRVRAAFQANGVRRVVMLSRLDRIKRVGLLFDALDRMPALAALRFDIYGSGEEARALGERARHHPNVTLHGFVPDATAALADADLLLHTCPEEPFGLVLLEAFAAGVPVLAPNSGGAGDIVHDGVNGWHFTANDPVALGLRLQVLASQTAHSLNTMVAGGHESLQTEHNPSRQAQRYAQLIAQPTAQATARAGAAA